MKLGVFTDSHYSTQEVTCGNRFNSKSLGKIKKAMDFFREEDCELVISLGDMIDRENDHAQEISNLRQVSDVLSGYDMPVYALMGNHDAFAFTTEEFYQVLGECYRPEMISLEEKQLIFLDTCYFKSGIHYQPGDEDWTDTFLPDACQLKENLKKSGADKAYIFLHQNIDPSVHESHRLYNDEEVRKILEESEKTVTVYQGHYHPGRESVHNGIRYITFPAMCEREDAYFILEI